MKFFELDHPPYSTWEDREAANPIRIAGGLWLPGVICSVCDATWAGGRRLYLPVADPSLRRKLTPEPLPLTEWVKLAQEVRQSLNLPNDYYLEPGDILGTPAAELLAPEVPDFMHPLYSGPGQLIVPVRVVLALRNAGLTGFRPIRVLTHWSKQVRWPPGEPPALYELMVTGTAWRVGIDMNQGIVCQHCGRRKFPDPYRLVVDEGRWDGSDFLHVDRNPNIVLVTERVYQVLAEHRFSNYACVPLASMLMLPEGHD